MQIIAERTGKEVRRVDVSSICELGGSLHCLTWALVGEEAAVVLAAAQATGGARAH